MLVTSFISVVLMANILIDQLHTLMNAQDFERAYAVALSQSENHQGDAAFDFYFGWAALETGHPDQAVIALERTLMINPDQPRARLELARAYSQLHQWDLAEEQLAL
ncbi:MAG: tetratricopeptide repeat protein, partial [Pseudomonadota bacterium]